MARPREFDESDALEKAMVAFWRQGYDETSYEDLVSATGVSRYGLYSAFGDKKDFFLRALDHYIEMNRCEMMGSLLKDGASLKDIVNYFYRVGERVNDPQKRIGCMLCNTAIEMAQYDKDAEAKVREIFTELKRVFKKAITTAVKSGEIKSAQSPNQLADYLVGLMMGAAMMVRSPMERGKIKNFIETGLAVLK